MLRRTLANFQISYKDKLQQFFPRKKMNSFNADKTISYKDKVQSNKFFPMNQNIRKNISFKNKLESKR